MKNTKKTMMSQRGNEIVTDIVTEKRMNPDIVTGTRIVTAAAAAGTGRAAAAIVGVTASETVTMETDIVTTVTDIVTIVTKIVIEMTNIAIGPGIKKRRQREGIGMTLTGTTIPRGDSPANNRPVGTIVVPDANPAKIAGELQPMKGGARAAAVGAGNLRGNRQAAANHSWYQSWSYREPTMYVRNSQYISLWNLIPQIFLVTN